MNIKELFYALFFFVNSVFTFSQHHHSAQFAPPIDIPLVLSSNFGEIRSNHFHSGLDFKTHGKTGLPIHSINSGYVYRIKVTSAGYGKALYILHPDNYVSVYGHLQEFSPEIEKYVKEWQYQKQRFEVDIFSSKGMFPVQKGAIIGKSGNSGYSFGPHLHFEVRGAKSEHPLNPLLFNFKVRDNIRPVVKSFFLYDCTKPSKNIARKKKVDLTYSGGQYVPNKSNALSVPKKFGIGVEAFDLLNDAPNKCGIYSIKVWMDEELYFYYEMDEFSFYETRYVNSHMDYYEYVVNKDKIHKTFLSPNNPLNAYKYVKNKGVIEVKDSLEHPVKIEISDVNGNISSIRFSVKYAAKNTYLPSVFDTLSITQVMPFAKKNEFRDENIHITLPPGALYDTLYFHFSKQNHSINSQEPLYQVHYPFDAIHRHIMIKIKPTKIPEPLWSKTVMVRLDEKNTPEYAGNTLEQGYISAEVREFGLYTLVIDTLAPEITPVDVTSNNRLLIKITDQISGIKEYRGTYDGKWALFEYDLKNDLLIFEMNEQRYPRTGKKHLISLQVKDHAGNVATFEKVIAR